MTVRARRARTNDVGGCNGCTNKVDELTVIGWWPTNTNGREVRLCDACLEGTFDAATHAEQFKPKPEPTGVIARKAAAKTAKLKTYGIIDYVPGAQGQQRLIVAAKSVTEACKLFGISKTLWRHSGSVTGNAEECDMATSRPGVVLHRDLNRRVGGWKTRSATIAARPKAIKTPARVRAYPARVPSTKAASA